MYLFRLVINIRVGYELDVKMAGNVAGMWITEISLRNNFNSSQLPLSCNVHWAELFVGLPYDCSRKHSVTQSCVTHYCLHKPSSKTHPYLGLLVKTSDNPRTLRDNNGSRYNRCTHHINSIRIRDCLYRHSHSRDLEFPVQADCQSAAMDRNTTSFHLKKHLCWSCQLVSEGTRRIQLTHFTPITGDSYNNAFISQNDDVPDFKPKN